MGIWYSNYSRINRRTRLMLMSAAESKELHLTKLKSKQQWKVETSPNNAQFVASAIYIVYIIQWGPLLCWINYQRALSENSVPLNLYQLIIMFPIRTAIKTTKTQNGVLKHGLKISQDRWTPRLSIPLATSEWHWDWLNPGFLMAPSGKQNILKLDYIM